METEIQGRTGGEMIPGLPEEIARECLLRLSFHTFPAARSVCRLWLQELQSPSYHRLRRSSRLSRHVIALAHCLPPLSPSGTAHKFAFPSCRLSLFDPTGPTSSSSWAPIPPIPSLPRGLPLFCQLTSLARLLVVVGGWDPDTWALTDCVFLYDLVSGSWRRGAPMPGPRRSFFACAASDDAVFVAGGHDEEKNALKSALAYDVAADRWVPLPDMALERDEARGLFVSRRFVVVGGYGTEEQGRFGSSAEGFDPASESWAPVEEGWLGEDGTCPRTLTSWDGEVYVVRAGRVWARARAQEEEGQKWTAVGELPEPARTAAAVAVGIRDGRVVVLGPGCPGGAQMAYVMEEGREEGKGKKRKVSTVVWRKVEVPPEFAGSVQAACCVEI